jgi:hypothetical protein
MGAIIVIFWLFFSLVAANIAANKGNSGLFTFLLSLIFSPLIGLMVASISNRNKTVLDNRGIKSGRLKRCPDCAEVIKSKAIVCHFCGKPIL